MLPEAPNPFCADRPGNLQDGFEDAVEEHAEEEYIAEFCPVFLADAPVDERQGGNKECLFPKHGDHLEKSIKEGAADLLDCNDDIQVHSSVPSCLIGENQLNIRYFQ